MKKTSAVKQSARAVWLAGLGVLATAGDEGGRLFQELVRRGEQANRGNRARVRKLTAGAGEIVQDAEATIGRKVFKPVDRGIALALHRLGVPTRTEILHLTRRVEALTRTVEKKQRRPRRAKKAHAPHAVPVA